MQNDGITINNFNVVNYDNINCYDRTNNDNIYEHGITNGIKKPNNPSDENRNDDDIKIYRYKFSDDFIIEMSNFAKIHQYDHRKVFKEAWEVWLEEYNEIVSNEIFRLTNLNYEGNVLNKMFKSARYYFRKKRIEKKEPLKRQKYITTTKNLLKAIDNHILLGIKQRDYKPSDGFDDFCKNNIEILKEQINSFCKNGLTDALEIKNKIKKTYKNRYFLVIK